MFVKYLCTVLIVLGVAVPAAAALSKFVLVSADPTMTDVQRTADGRHCTDVQM